jgi:hypothetical protein
MVIIQLLKIILKKINNRHSPTVNEWRDDKQTKQIRIFRKNKIKIPLEPAKPSH